MFEITFHEVKLKKKLTELSLKHCLRFKIRIFFFVFVVMAVEKIRNKAVDMNGLWLTVPLLIREMDGMELLEDCFYQLARTFCFGYS